MGFRSNLYTKAIDPIGFFRKGSRFNEGRNKLFGLEGGNIYGIGDKSNPEDNPTVDAIVAASQEEDDPASILHLATTTDRGNIYVSRNSLLGG